jgi:hypothetical protein
MTTSAVRCCSLRNFDAFALAGKIPSRQRLFNDMRALTTYICFESWDALFDFMLKGWSARIPKLSSG